MLIKVCQMTGKNAIIQLLSQQSVILILSLRDIDSAFSALRLLESENISCLKMRVEVASFY